MVNKIYSWLLALAIVLSPLNLFFRWAENQAYINGLFVDYLIPKIWLAELPIILMLLIWLVTLIKNKQLNIFKNKLFFSLLLLIFVRQFFAINNLIALVSFFRILELIGLGVFLKHQFKHLNQSLVYGFIAISLLGQILLANYQFFQQKNLLPYKFLGESKLTSSINIAKTQLKTGLTINPYGSTAHPNILAGFLVVNLLILLNQLKTDKQNQVYLGWSGVALVSWTVFLTQSYSAILSLSIFLILKTFSSLITKLSLKLLLALTIGIPFGLFYLDQKIELLSISRRNFLNLQGLKIWLKNFWLGVGFNNFFYQLETNHSSETVRFLQPIHHTLLLWLTETGSLGLGLLIGLRAWLKQEKVLLALFTLLPIITLDHYLSTQWLGGWLLITMVLL